MNIILLIFAFISTISLITYAQLSNLRELAAVRKEYACYMENQERADFIAAQNKLYDEYHREGKKKEEDGSKPIQASRKLNLYSFLFAQEDSTRSYTIDMILKNLLDILYGEQTFYIKLKEKRPYFVEELIQKLKSALKEDKKFDLDKPANLCNIELHDEEFQYFLALILSGTQTKCGETEGVHSLEPLIETKKNVLPIRIQLTSKEMLLAIYRNPQVVNEILDRRHELQKLVERDLSQKTTASQSFKESFENLIPRGFDLSFFNFEITTTK